MKKAVLSCSVLLVLFLGMAVSPSGHINLKSKKMSFNWIQTMAMAYASEEPCEPPLTTAQFLACTGCEATTDDVSCVGKDGRTYSFAKVPEVPIGG